MLPCNPPSDQTRRKQYSRRTGEMGTRVVGKGRQKKHSYDMNSCHGPVHLQLRCHLWKSVHQKVLVFGTMVVNVFSAVLLRFQMPTFLLKKKKCDCTSQLSFCRPNPVNSRTSRLLRLIRGTIWHRWRPSSVSPNVIVSFINNGRRHLSPSDHLPKRSNTTITPAVE